MNLKRWEEKEGFKSRVGCRLQMIGGSQFTGGASVFFKYHTSLLFTIKGDRALDGLARRRVVVAWGSRAEVV